MAKNDMDLIADWLRNPTFNHGGFATITSQAVALTRERVGA